MSTMPDLAAIAALIAEPSRAAMLAALLGGLALPAGELARCAGITPQTASAHLAKLVEGGLLRVATTGRHRYFRLSGAPVARALEALALVAPPARARTLSGGLANQALREARLCYDHLAGRLGVSIAEALERAGLVEGHAATYEVTAAGARWFAGLGVECAVLVGARRAFAPVCIDWSERRPHLAGSLGAALARHLLAAGWVVRVEGARAVRVTASGRAGLRQVLDLEWAPPADVLGSIRQAAARTAS